MTVSDDQIRLLRDRVQKEARHEGAMRTFANVLSTLTRLAAGTYSGLTRTASPMDDVVDAAEALREQGRQQGVETMRVELCARATRFRQDAARFPEGPARFTLMDRADCLDAAATQLGRP